MKLKRTEGTNMDNVPKVEDEGLLSSVVGHFRHIKLRKDDSSKSLDGNNAFLTTYRGHAYLK